MDELDITQDCMDKELAMSLEFYAKDIPKGKEGECMSCGMMSPRIINGECPPCRDQREKYKGREHYKGD